MPFPTHQSSGLDVEFPNLGVVQHHCGETGRSVCLAVGVDVVLADGRQRLEDLDFAVLGSLMMLNSKTHPIQFLVLFS